MPRNRSSLKLGMVSPVRNAQPLKQSVPLQIHRCYRLDLRSSRDGKMESGVSSQDKAWIRRSDCVARQIRRYCFSLFIVLMVLRWVESTRLTPSQYSDII